MTDDSFLGNALNGIDAKNRVSVPSTFREVIAARSDARIVVLSPAERADCLVGYDLNYSVKTRAELERRFDGDYSEARDDRFRATFGSAERVPVDENGRIILSAAMKDIASIERSALFWGMGDFFEVWNPQTFIERPNLDPRIVRIVRRAMDMRGGA